MSGLLALLDDVAAIAKLAASQVDDIAAHAVKAGGKSAGIVIDDAAVTPKYVTSSGRPRNTHRGQNCGRLADQQACHPAAGAPFAASFRVMVIETLRSPLWWSPRPSNHLLGRGLFCWLSVASTPQHFCKWRRYRPSDKKGEPFAMRMLIICTTLVATAVGLSGCWWHHQAAVVTEPMAPPLKLGS